MSSTAVRALIVIYCSVIAYCNAGKNITAYVKEHLTTAVCVSVPQIRDVCNVDWKLRKSDEEIYESMIESINTTISSSEIYRGLSAGDAMHCRKMYENMMCRDTFPVCDLKRMVIDHGDAKARCEYAKDACTTISIEGCDFSTNGVESIVSEANKCETITANTSKLCPDAQLKVPKKYNRVFADDFVKQLSTIAEMFSKELKNRTNMARCEMKYKEVLCRLLDTCSPDGFYYLHYINRAECEEMISCVKSAGFSQTITSVCSKAYIAEEDSDTVTVRNPYNEELPLLTTLETPTTFAETDPSTTNKMRISSGSKKDSETMIPTSRVPTSETLVESSDESKNPAQTLLNNTISKKSHKPNNPRGKASGIYQNFSLVTVAFTLYVYFATHLLNYLRIL